MDMSQGYDGWGEYYDERGMGGFVQQSMGSVSSPPLIYVPNLQSVGSGSAYWPGSVSNDAVALNYLGFIPDAILPTLSPSTGSQAGDMGQSAGAWDQDFITAVKDFQGLAGVTQDGWIGPQTRTALAAAVTAKNLSASPVAPPMPLPAIPILPNGPPPIAPVPGGGGTLPGILVQPASQQTTEGLSTNAKIGIGVGIAALLGVGYWALSDG